MAEYTGAVAVGGPSQTRSAGGLKITKVAVGQFDNNSYFLECEETGDVLIVDAANEADRLLEELGDRHLAGILTTHRHADHWGALEAVAKATGAVTYAHPADADELPLPPDALVPDFGAVKVGNIELEAIHLVGHTPGSIALLHAENSGTPHLFTGDCLFPGGVGNTWNDAKAFESLYDGVKTKVFERLPDTTWIYPGHGGDTNLGNERPHLAEWRERGW